MSKKVSKKNVLQDEDVSGEDDFLDDNDLLGDDELLGDFDGDFDESLDGFRTNINDQSEIHKIWLDTEHYLNNIFLSITNQKINKIKSVKNGKTVYKTDIVNIDKNLKPLANNLGVSQIMAELKVYLSTPLVQGNLDNNKYVEFMWWYSKEITVLLYSNRLKWGISLSDVRGIYNKIIGSISLFLTRPIGNLERGRDKWTPEKSGDEERGIIGKFRNMRRKNAGYMEGGRLNG
jgi:hypothetical protein